MAKNEQPQGAAERPQDLAASASAQPDARFDIRSHVAQTLIDAMEKGETPWQRPWNATALRPMNPTSQNGYRGVNRILLSLAPAGQGGDNRWVTYQQAQAKGWQVRKGEKGTMIVKVVELGPDRGEQGGDGARAAGARRANDPADSQKRRNAVALRRYFVFNATQIDGIPPLEDSEELAFDPVAKGEAVLEAFTS